MRRKSMRRLYALHRAQANANGIRHSTARPMGRLASWAGEGQIDDALDDFGIQRGLARRARPVTQQAIDAFALEAFLPTPDDRLRQS